MMTSNEVNCYQLDESRILVVESKCPDLCPIKWITEHLEFINQYIDKEGGILFRNFELNSVSKFNKLATALCGDLAEYVYRSTPRTRLGGNVYTATEYPAEKTISLHNECSYSLSWPKRLLFYCAIAPSEGGETPLADSRIIYNNIDENIRTKFEKLGVMYRRNYIENIDLSWQEVFQKDKPGDVEEYCKQNNISFEWKNGVSQLMTEQKCQSTILNLATRQKVWFNQAHLFHLSALDIKTQQFFIKEFGLENLPRNSFYGDGSEIEVDALEHIHEVYKNNKIKFSWDRSDFLIINNELFSHAREPFKGERKIVVAMS